MVLLPLLQHYNGHVQNLICVVPPSHCGQAYPHVDHIRSINVHGRWRRCVFLRYTLAVSAAFLLLEQAPERSLPRHANNYCAGISVQCFQRYHRFDICHSSSFCHLAFKLEEEGAVHPHCVGRHGMRVSCEAIPLQSHMVLIWTFSASLGVIIRFGYMKNFNDPDFLCMYCLILSTQTLSVLMAVF